MRANFFYPLKVNRTISRSLDIISTSIILQAILCHLIRFYTSLSPIFKIALSNSKCIYVLFKAAILKTIYQVPLKKLLSILSLRFAIFFLSFPSLYFFFLPYLFSSYIIHWLYPYAEFYQR